MCRLQGCWNSGSMSSSASNEGGGTGERSESEAFDGELHDLIPVNEAHVAPHTLPRASQNQNNDPNIEPSAAVRRGRPPRQSRSVEARSLLQYFNSSRNVEDTRPLLPIPVMGVNDLINIRRQREPLGIVPAEPLTSVPPLPLKSGTECRVPRRTNRPLEVPLRIGSPTGCLRNPRNEAVPLVTGKGKEAAVEGKEKRKAVEKSNRSKKRVPPPGEGSGPRKPLERMIDEDGNEFVNCSDEETMFVLSEDDDINVDVPTSLPNPVLRRRQYEASRRFQDTWAAKLPWAEMSRTADGTIELVKCLICSLIEKREKLLKAKWDTLTKHAGRRKALKDMRGIARKGEYYYSKDCAHAKNAVLYAQRNHQTVHQLVQNEGGERSRKRVQFATVFHVLQEGRPMLEYESLNRLLNFLRVPHMPKKHWSDDSGWQMAEIMHAQINLKMMEVIKHAQFFAVTCDEVTSVDNASWIAIHIYTQQNWVREPMLLSLQPVLDARAPTLTGVISEALRVRGGLSREEIATRFVAFGADGASVFQGVRTGVTRQLVDDHACWMHGSHCLCHRLDLALKILAKMAVVSNVEDLLGAIHGYFAHSSKRHYEFMKLAALMEKKGLKILKQVKTRWISMLKPAKRILTQYPVLLYKMHLDAPTLKTAQTNLEFLLDVQTLLGLACLMPMLEEMNRLIKFAQSRNIFVCDFVAALRHCQTELFTHYQDARTAFESDIFYDFNALSDLTHDNIKMSWKSDLNTMEEQLVFECNGVPIWAKYKEADSEEAVFVSRAAWTVLVAHVKSSSTGKYYHSLISLHLPYYVLICLSIVSKFQLYSDHFFILVSVIMQRQQMLCRWN